MMRKRVSCLLSIMLALIIVAYFFKLYFIVFILTCIMLTIIFSTFLTRYGKATRQWRKVPNLLDDITRNYKKVYLGYKALDTDGLDLTQQYSNLYSDYLLLQRYYSLGDSNCRFIINIHASKRYQYSCSPSLFSLNMLHPITLLEHNTWLYRYEMEWGEFLTPMVFYLKHYFYDWVEKFCCYVNCSAKSNVNYELIRQILGFAKSRNLLVKIYVDGRLLDI